MIYYFFGKPGVGKTGHGTYNAFRFNEKINHILFPDEFKKFNTPTKYRRILANYHFSVPVSDEKYNHCFYFDNDDIGKYDMSDSLILFDESTLKFDGRDYAKMSPYVKQFLVLHRHYNCDIFFYNQFYHGIDNKIRELTTGVYQLKKTLRGKVITRPIIYDIMFPPKPTKSIVKKSAEHSGGQEYEGYFRGGLIDNLLCSLFTFPTFKLRDVWNFYDSFDAPPLPVKEFERMKLYAPPDYDLDLPID